MNAPWSGLIMVSKRLKPKRLEPYYLGLFLDEEQRAPAERVAAAAPIPRR